MKDITISDLGPLIQSAESVFLPGSSGEPIPMIDQISEHPDWSRGATLITSFVSGLNRANALSLHPSAVVKRFFPDSKDSHSQQELFRCSYREIDESLKNMAPDMAICVVTPPDKNGACTPAAAAEFAETSLLSASIRLALVNEAAPHLPNSPLIPYDSFTHALHVTFPLLHERPNSKDRQSAEIAAHIAKLISDGATIQTGIGKIPGQVLEKLVGHKNLHLHSGIIGSQLRSLYMAGALAEKQTACSASVIGDSAFYSWVDGNRHIKLAPVHYTHAADTLAGIDGFISINSAIEVDLLGCVNAEWVGQRRISAPGGLPNFSEAAQRDPNGLSIIALPATNSRGDISRIVPKLSDHILPTIDHRHVDIVTTEYGSADLRLLDSESRANALISIAAPQFRQSLRTSLMSAKPTAPK